MSIPLSISERILVDRINECSGVIKLLYRHHSDEIVKICNEVLDRNDLALKVVSSESKPKGVLLNKMSSSHNHFYGTYNDYLIQIERDHPDSSWVWLVIASNGIRCAEGIWEGSRNKPIHEAILHVIHVCSLNVIDELEQLSQSSLTTSSIIVNGRECTWGIRDISYESVVELSNSKYKGIHTITYKTGNLGGSGTLYPGQKVDVVKNMVFNCLNTSAA